MRALNNCRPRHPVADGLELVQDQADIAPGVPRPDLGRPLEEQGQDAQFDVTNDPGTLPNKTICASLDFYG